VPDWSSTLATITDNDMKKYRPLLLFISSLGLPLQTHAAESESPCAEMGRLVTTDRFEEALNLGTRNLEEWEGDPEFGFVYGLEALEGLYTIERQI
jgi:hypothetical protein